MSSAKHRLSADPLPVAKRLHTALQDPSPGRQQHRLSFDFLSDELILCIFSYLSSADLCVAQGINKTWNRLSRDNELWKNHYLRTFGRTRLRGSRGFVGLARADGREVRPLPTRASLAPGDVKDWKWMFRISTNWRKGRCAIGELAKGSGLLSAESSAFRTHVLLAGDLTITASSEPSETPTIHVFDQCSNNYSMPCKPHVTTDLTEITAIAIDQSPPLLGQLRLVSCLSSGEFAIFSINPSQLARSSRILSFIPSQRRARALPSLEAVYHHPLLVTLSHDFTLSIYDLSGDGVRNSQTLSSFTSFPPASLVLSSLARNTYKLVIAYAIPVYPAHWTIGATELIISRSASSANRSDEVASSTALCVISTRTTRALDVPSGWIDEDKLQAMREQWGRKLARVADTQTDGKWIVLASGEETRLSCFNPSSRSSVSTIPGTSSTPLQLYRLYLPPSTSVASPLPKLTFVRTLHGQMGPISSLALSDGRCVSLGLNGSIWVWDLEAGAGVEASAGSASLSPAVLPEKGVIGFDEKRIVTTEEGRVLIRRFDI